METNLQSNIDVLKTNYTKLKTALDKIGVEIDYTTYSLAENKIVQRYSNLQERISDNDILKFLFEAFNEVGDSHSLYLTEKDVDKIRLDIGGVVAQYLKTTKYKVSKETMVKDVMNFFINYPTYFIEAKMVNIIFNGANSGISVTMDFNDKLIMTEIKGLIMKAEELYAKNLTHLNNGDLSDVYESLIQNNGRVKTKFNAKLNIVRREVNNHNSTPVTDKVKITERDLVEIFMARPTVTDRLEKLFKDNKDREHLTKSLVIEKNFGVKFKLDNTIFLLTYNGLINTKTMTVVVPRMSGMSDYEYIQSVFNKQTFGLDKRTIGGMAILMVYANDLRRKV